MSSVVAQAARQGLGALPRWIAIHLDGLAAQAIAQHEREAWRGGIPPAALVSRWDGEPVRGDVAGPPHVRGAGAPWPPEAVVQPGTGSGRFPIAYAWRALESGKSWSWTYERSRRTLDPAEAIAAAAAAVVASRSAARARPEVVLVVPNALTESAQEAIIDRSRRLGLKVRLLWRPVATALAWLSRFEEEILAASKDVLLESAEQDIVVGRVLTVHIGVEGCESASIPLIARRVDGAWRLLPGRRRPQRDPLRPDVVPESVPGAGRRQVERLAAALAAHSGGAGAADSAGVDRLWSLHWGSSELVAAFDGLRRSGEGPNSRLWLSALSGDPRSHVTSVVLPPVLTLAGDEPRDRDLKSAIRAAANVATKGEAILGLALTGCMAGTLLGRERLGVRACADAGIASARTLIEGVAEGEWLVTRGAARFAAALQEDEVVYLDTLPQLRIVATRDGEPTWQPLLAVDDRWVDGGRPWRREPPFAGLVVRQGQEVLEVNLHHEEYTTVRTLTVTLPAVTAQVLPVSLDISMEPAQGRARIEVVPGVAGAFGRRRVWVEWSAMKDTTDTPGGYLDAYPRLFPPLHPRLAAYDKWRQIRERFDDVLPFVPAGGRPFGAATLSRLDTFAQKLRDRQPSFFDRKTGSRDASGIDCNGVPAMGGDTQYLHDLVSRLLVRLPAVDPKEREGKLVIRTLGYTSTPEPAFQEYLVRRMRRVFTGLTAEEVRACGWCIRKPADIARFAELVLDRLRSDSANGDWVKALSEMLRFRADAARSLESAMAEKLCSELLNTFNAQVDRGRGQYIFRTSCLSIVYLLRRRAYDDDFLDPNGILAMKIKAAFSRAATEAKAGRLQLVGGAIDLPVELKRLIDYIDRRGHGLPGIGIADD